MTAKNRIWAIFVVLFSLLFIGWGWVGHHIIGRNAVLSFPPEMAPFFYWADSLAEHGSDADYRKDDDPAKPRNIILTSIHTRNF